MLSLLREKLDKVICLSAGIGFILLSRLRTIKRMWDDVLNHSSSNFVSDVKIKEISKKLLYTNNGFMLYRLFTLSVCI